MRHRKNGLQLNRFSSWRSATLKSLVRSLLIHQSIKTTRMKAKAAKSLADSLIDLGKGNTLEAKRRAYVTLGEHVLVSLLFNEIAPRLASRSGGYTRILSLGKRRGDNAELALLELTEIKKKEKKAPQKAKAAKVEETPLKEEATAVKEKPAEEKKAPVATAVKEKHQIIKKKPSKKFLGGLRSIFKKERDAL